MKKIKIILLALFLCFPATLVLGQGVLKGGLSGLFISPPVKAQERAFLEKAFGLSSRPQNALFMTESGKVPLSAVSLLKSAASLEKQVRLAAQIKLLQDKTLTWMESDYQFFQFYMQDKYSKVAFPVLYLAPEAGMGEEIVAFMQDLMKVHPNNIYLVGQFGPKMILINGTSSQAHAAFHQASADFSGEGFLTYDPKSTTMSWNQFSGALSYSGGPLSTYALEHFFFTHAGLPSVPKERELIALGSGALARQKILQEYVSFPQAPQKPVAKVNTNLPEHIALMREYIAKKDPHAILVVVSSSACYSNYKGLAERTAPLIGQTNQVVIHFSTPRMVARHPSLWNHAAGMTSKALGRFSVGEKLFQEVVHPSLAPLFGSDVRVIVYSK